jgi:hypothetical protein
MLNDYFANVCFKYFICSRRMLQLFHLSVAKVDLDLGLLSEEERLAWEPWQRRCGEEA